MTRTAQRRRLLKRTRPLRQYNAAVMKARQDHHQALADRSCISGYRAKIRGMKAGDKRCSLGGIPEWFLCNEGLCNYS